LFIFEYPSTHRCHSSDFFKFWLALSEIAQINQIDVLIIIYDDAITQCKMRTFGLSLRQMRGLTHVQHNSLGRVSTKLN